jgi:hypothetical protein
MMQIKHRQNGTPRYRHTLNTAYTHPLFWRWQDEATHRQYVENTGGTVNKNRYHV